MSEWEKRARHCGEVYGSYIDWEERFFACPFCGEPIYECDWEDDEWSDDFICPVCELGDEDAD